jgi:hypothetical protein
MTGGRPAIFPPWMVEADIRIKPLKPVELSETLGAIRDAQADVLIHFDVLLRHPSSAAMDRLMEARERERDVFRTILGQDTPSWERKVVFNRVESYSDAT